MSAAVVRLASAVTVGNTHLADYARRYNDRVHIVPSRVSLRESRTRPVPPRLGPVVLGVNQLDRGELAVECRPWSAADEPWVAL